MNLQDKIDPILIIKMIVRAYLIGLKVGMLSKVIMDAVDGSLAFPGFKANVILNDLRELMERLSH